MKIFDFFYSEKIIFHRNKKNFTIVQQGEGLATLNTMDDKRRGAEGGGGGGGGGV